MNNKRIEDVSEKNENIHLSDIREVYREAKLQINSDIAPEIYRIEFASGKSLLVVNDEIKVNEGFTIL